MDLLGHSVDAGVGEDLYKKILWKKKKKKIIWARFSEKPCDGLRLSFN